VEARFDPPEEWIRVLTIDAHTGGEPLRVVTEGWPELPGDTILAKREHAREHHERLRRALMWEPRGHADMYGCIPTEPVTPDGDVGVLFLHNEGYSTMCGHGIIGLVKVGLECGMFDPSDLDSDESGHPLIRIDTPAGRVTARAHLAPGATPDAPPRVARVSFHNVPSFVLEPDLHVGVPGLGPVRCDIAFGGAFYAYVDATDLDLVLEPSGVTRLIDAGRRIKRSVMEQHRIAHPSGDPALGFLYGVIFVAPAEGVHSRHVCVFADGEVDRSPTGTGVSGRAAILHRAGELAMGESITIDSIIATRFDVKVVALTGVGEVPAIVPEVTGDAFITGRHEFLIDPADPLQEGFFLR
jgi:proline racemase